MLVCNEIRLTNEQYFAKYCYISDLPRIARMFERHLETTIGRDVPRFKKEREYDLWLGELFDPNEWDFSKTKTDTEHWW